MGKRGVKSKITQEGKDAIIKAYKENKTDRKEIQERLSKKLGISTRHVRRLANDLGVGVMAKNVISPAKVMVYDIETSRIKFWGWWTGKQYVGHNQIIDEPKMITVSWKWLGEDKIHYLTWDKDHCDKKMMKAFLKQYNKADMVIGYNNDRFDNRWINARAMKYDLEVNTFVKSFDIMKEEKKVFRVPSYSMAYMSKYANVVQKQGHEGILMWDMIQTGTKVQQKEYLQKMVDYNIGDIAATEELYFRLRKYFGHRMHFGVLHGEEKYTCPTCGTSNVKMYRKTVTTAGTIQIVMQCNKDKVKYKINNKNYMNFLDFKYNN